MYVELEGEGRARVHEPDDLLTFSVRSGRCPDLAAVRRALGTLGAFDDAGHAWIDIEQLREATGRTADAEWCSGFDAMVAYAATKGWVSDDGTALRAHLDDRG